jgi:hypothetical protein
VFYLLLLREANDGATTIPTTSPSFSSYAPSPQPDHLQGPLGGGSRKRPLPRPDTSPSNMGGTEVRQAGQGSEGGNGRSAHTEGRQRMFGGYGLYPARERSATL